MGSPSDLRARLSAVAARFPLLIQKDAFEALAEVLREEVPVDLLAVTWLTQQGDEMQSYAQWVRPPATADGFPYGFRMAATREGLAAFSLGSRVVVRPTLDEALFQERWRRSNIGSYVIVGLGEPRGGLLFAGFVEPGLAARVAKEPLLELADLFHAGLDRLEVLDEVERRADEVAAELRRRNRELKVLSGVARAAATESSFALAAGRSLELLVPYLAGTSGVMVRVDGKKGDRLDVVAAEGAEREALVALLAAHRDELTPGGGPVRLAWDGGREALCARLSVDGVVRGLLAFGGRARRKFGPRERALVHAAGDTLAGALASALRYEATRATRAEHEQMRDHLPVIIYRRVLDDPSQSYVSAGIERILGYTKEEATRPDFRPDFAIEPGAVPFVEEVRAHIATGAPIPWQDVALRHKDGREVMLRVMVHPVCDDKGRLEVLEAVGVDVTAARATQRQLVVADRLAALGLLAAGVGHEVNNPAAFISLGVQQIARIVKSIRQTGDAAPHLDRLDGVLADMEEGVQRISSIVGELRAFSRSPDAVGGYTDVNALIRSAVALVDTELRARARIEMRLGELPPQPGAYQRLSQVFLNLLINAAQAIPLGAPARHRVTLESGVVEGQIRVVVRDSGPGIRPDVLPRIFDPFFTTKPPGEGTGLGLAISFDLVKRLGGQLSVETRVGEGTAFTVSVPALASPERDPRRPAPGGVRRDILVVDDEDALARVMARELGRGHRVETALGGEDALGLLEGRWFDVVLCDLRMPGITGPEVYRRTAERSPAQAARFVFVTGAAAAPEEARFLAWAGRPVIEKPFDAEALWVTLDSVIGGA